MCVRVSVNVITRRASDSKALKLEASLNWKVDSSCGDLVNNISSAVRTLAQFHSLMEKSFRENETKIIYDDCYKDIYASSNSSSSSPSAASDASVVAVAADSVEIEAIQGINKDRHNGNDNFEDKLTLYR